MLIRNKETHKCSAAKKLTRIKKLCCDFTLASTVKVKNQKCRQVKSPFPHLFFPKFQNEISTVTVLVATANMFRISGIKTKRWPVPSAQIRIVMQ